MEKRRVYLNRALELFLLEDTMKKQEFLANLKKLLEVLLDEMNITSLFRYASFQKHDNDNDTWIRDKITLEENKFYLTPMSNQNDPFEFKQDTNYDRVTEEILFKNPLKYINRQQYDEVAKRTHTDICNGYDALRNKISIKSFCEDVDNLLLWSHYANSHTGYCIEYDSIKLFELWQYLLLPIVYQEQYPKVHFSTIQKEVFMNNLRCLATKSKHWEYENEWRIVRCCNTKEDHKGEAPIPKSIYLGCKVKAGYEKDMFELCKKRNITLYKMKISQVSYTLQKELIFKGENQ